MSTRAGRAMVAVAILAVALAAAWLVPPLAPVVVWPFLLVVPGWALVAAVEPRVDAAGRLGLAIVASVATSTHLVHWLSHLAGGYTRETVFFAAALLALPVVAAAWRGVLSPTA